MPRERSRPNNVPCGTILWESKRTKNWSGTWPGLVGMLNLNASLTKAGVKYSTIWSEDFTDLFFRQYLRDWLAKGHVKHKAPHVVKFGDVKVGARVNMQGAAEYTVSDAGIIAARHVFDFSGTLLRAGVLKVKPA